MRIVIILLVLNIGLATLMSNLAWLRGSTLTPEQLADHNFLSLVFPEVNHHSSSLKPSGGPEAQRKGTLIVKPGGAYVGWCPSAYSAYQKPSSVSVPILQLQLVPRTGSRAYSDPQLPRLTKPPQL